MSNPLNLPFLPGYVAPGADSSILSNVTGAISSAVTAGEQAATQAAETVVTDATGAATQAVESVIPGVAPTTPAITPSTGAVAIPTPGPVTDITSVIENTAKSAAGEALSGIAGDLEGKVEAEVAKALTKIISGPPTPPALSDFIHADARGRAFRSLGIGLLMSVLWGVVSVLGVLAGYNWFDSHSWPTLITLVVSSVVASVSSYVARLVKEPASTAPITTLLASAPAPRH